MDETGRYDFWWRFLLHHSPFLFPLFLGGKRKGEWSSKNRYQKSYLSVPSNILLVLFWQQICTLLVWRSCKLKEIFMKCCFFDEFNEQHQHQQKLSNLLLKQHFFVYISCKLLHILVGSLSYVKSSNKYNFYKYFMH